MTISKDAPDETPKGKSGRGSTPVPPRSKKGRPGVLASSGARSGGGGGKPGGSGARAGGSGPRSKSAARQARRRRNRLAGIAVAVVVIVIAVVVIIGLSSSGSSGKKATPRTPLPASVSTHLQSIAVNDLVAASASTGSNLASAETLSGSPLKSGNKPEILFIGAEFCPICAAERWPMMVALSQFGTFTNVKQLKSSPIDTPPNIPTLSFYQSTYSSPYFTFTPVEVYTNIPGNSYYLKLQTPTAAQNTIWADTLGGASNESFPFLDIGGKYLVNTMQYSNTVLEGKTSVEVAGDVGNNDTTIGANIDAAAAALTKYICDMDGNQPSKVCAAVANVAAPLSSSSSGATSPAG